MKANFIHDQLSAMTSSQLPTLILTKLLLENTTWSPRSYDSKSCKTSSTVIIFSCKRNQYLAFVTRCKVQSSNDTVDSEDCNSKMVESSQSWVTRFAHLVCFLKIESVSKMIKTLMIRLNRTKEASSVHSHRQQDYSLAQEQLNASATIITS